MGKKLALYEALNHREAKAGLAFNCTAPEVNSGICIKALTPQWGGEWDEPTVVNIRHLLKSSRISWRSTIIPSYQTKCRWWWWSELRYRRRRCRCRRRRWCRRRRNGRNFGQAIKASLSTSKEKEIKCSPSRRCVAAGLGNVDFKMSTLKRQCQKRRTIHYLNGPFPASFTLFSSFLNCNWQKCTKNLISFAYDGIRTMDLWCRKRPLPTVPQPGPSNI